jgi:hypothetical protein
MASNIFIGATGWENSDGGGASSWNDNAGGVATNDNNFGETGRDNFNDNYGGDAHGGGGAGGGSCRRCGQGKLSSYIIGALVSLTCHQMAISPTCVTRFVSISLGP